MSLDSAVESGERVYQEMHSTCEARIAALESALASLGAGIAELGAKAGIYNGEIPLTGPEALLLLQNVATTLAETQRERT